MMQAARLLARIANRVLYSVLEARRLLRNSTVVFLYHEVSDSPSLFNQMFDLNVRPAEFAKQLDLIGDFFHFIDPDEFLTAQHPTPAALVTFDDGNLSYFREALPILKQKNIPSVMFLNMGPIKGEVCWAGLVTFLQNFEPGFFKRSQPKECHFVKFNESEVSDYLRMVNADLVLERVRSYRGSIASEEDLAAIATEPLIYLGNHLYNHYSARILSENRLREEYWKNQRIVDTHPRGRRLFSYPFGQPVSCYNENTTRLLIGEGARVIFSSYPLPNFQRRGRFYNRVGMTETVKNQADLYQLIMNNYLRARLRLAPEMVV